MRKALVALAVLGLLGRAGGKGGDQSPVRICDRLEDVLSPGQGAILLVFFSPDCSSCYEDLFEMRYLVDKNGWPAAVIGIASGLRRDLEVFLEKYDWPLPVVWDRRKKVFGKFGVRVAPFKILLIGSDVVYRDDPYKDFVRRRSEITECLIDIFSQRYSS